LVYDEAPEYVVVFGADHVYRMDPMQMIEAHIDSVCWISVSLSLSLSMCVCVCAVSLYFTAWC